MKKYIFLMFLMLSFFSISKVNATESIELVTNAKSAMLMEVSTGTIIYEHNADEKLAPASMTKIMTMLLVLEAIDNNVISMDTILTTSEYASSMGGSQIYLEVGEKMSVEDLFKSMCIASANDASVVLAESVGGTYENFILMMNKKAEELGMENTTFKNCNGLPEDDHLSSSRDIAILSRYIVSKYQEKILNYTSTYEDYIRKDSDNKFWLVNTNKLVKYIDGVKGLKTGYCGEESGYCLSAVLDRKSTQYIAVVMGCKSAKIRNYEVVNMLNYAYNNYELHTLYKKDEVIEKIESRYIHPNNISIVSNLDVNILKHKGENLTNLETKIVYDVNFDNVEKILNRKIGYLEVRLDGKLIATYELSTSTEVKKETLMNMFLRILKEIFFIS